MYSKWLGLCPLFNVHLNVVWLKLVQFGTERWLSATEKRKGIVHLLGIFHTLLEYLIYVLRIGFQTTLLI